MFKLVVLSVLLAFAAAAPSVVHGVVPVATYSAVVGSVPSSVSHSSSSVVHSAEIATPVVAAPVVAAAPLVAAHAVAAPVAVAHSVLGSVPASVSHSSSSVVHSAAIAAPVVAAAPAVISTYAAGPVVHAAIPHVVAVHGAHNAHHW